MLPSGIAVLRGRICLLGEIAVVRQSPDKLNAHLSAVACIEEPGYYYGNWPIAPNSDKFVSGSFGGCCDLCTIRATCVAFTYWPINGAGKVDCVLFQTLVNNELFPNAAAISSQSACLWRPRHLLTIIHRTSSALMAPPVADQSRIPLTPLPSPPPPSPPPRSPPPPLQSPPPPKASPPPPPPGVHLHSRLTDQIHLQCDWTLDSVMPCVFVRLTLIINNPIAPNAPCRGVLVP